MKKFIVVLNILFSFFLISTDVQAGNPGRSAMNCISASTNSEEYNNLVFNNQCGYKVFVVWCGDLKWSKKKCGDGPKSSYFTKSVNIDAYGKQTTTLNKGGTYQYAACEGTIGFGSHGIEHPASDGGSFRCTRTGSGH